MAAETAGASVSEPAGAAVAGQAEAAEGLQDDLKPVERCRVNELMNNEEFKMWTT